MAKHPRPGRSKTRLVPPLTDELAAALAECFVLDVVDIARSVPDAVPLVAIWPASSASYFRRIAPEVGQVVQVGESLGERLDHVLTSCLDDGFDQVVAINGDGPTLPVGRITSAFEALGDESTDMVLGPADDGGYYLIGWKRRYPSLVRGVEMSTPRVLSDTLELADAAGLRVALLDPWYDVDVPADLDRLVRELDDGDASAAHTARLVGDHPEVWG